MSDADGKGFEAPGEGAPFDPDELRERLGGDQEAAAAVLRAFTRDAPDQLARLRDAVDRNDGGEVRFLAHKLKGSLLWIGAADGADAASTLEQSASSDPAPSLRRGLAELTKRVDRLLSAIASRPGG